MKTGSYLIRYFFLIFHRFFPTSHPFLKPYIFVCQQIFGKEAPTNIETNRNGPTKKKNDETKRTAFASKAWITSQWRPNDRSPKTTGKIASVTRRGLDLSLVFTHLQPWLNRVCWGYNYLITRGGPFLYVTRYTSSFLPLEAFSGGKIPARRAPSLVGTWSYGAPINGRQ